MNRFTAFKQDEDMSKIDRFFNQIKHWWHSKTIYTIHSPFLFDYLEFVLDKNRSYYAFIVLEKRKKTSIQNLKKNETKGSGRPFLLKTSVCEHIFRHFIYTKGVNFLQLGSKGGWLGLYCNMAGAQNSILVDPHSLHSPLIRDAYYSEQRSLQHFKTLEDLMGWPQKPNFDCICIHGKNQITSSTLDKLLKISHPQATFIITEPNAWENQVLEKIEKHFSLVLRTDSFQVMWRRFDGETQKVNFTSKSWTKPWEFIHAI